eukprot:1044628-Prymnesium_polylepis.1
MDDRAAERVPAAHPVVRLRAADDGRDNVVPAQPAEARDGPTVRACVVGYHRLAGARVPVLRQVFPAAVRVALGEGAALRDELDALLGGRGGAASGCGRGGEVSESGGASGAE